MRTLRQINSTFTKSAFHTKTSCIWTCAFTSFCTLNWSISNVLLHIGFFSAFVTASIGHHVCSSCTSTEELTLGFSGGNYCTIINVCVGVCVCTVHTGRGQKKTNHNTSLMPSLCWDCSISSVLVWGSVYRLFSKLTCCFWKTNCGHFSFLSIKFLYVWNILSTQNSRNSGTFGTTIF